MAATQTVRQVPEFFNSISDTTKSITPRHGVVTLFGYGIKVNVNRGHLEIDDGVGRTRRRARFARVRHGLRRLVVIGSDGSISLAALRWLADQDAAFVMLDRDGSVLVTTGPVRSSDARLRRAQSLADHSGSALEITRELICQKLVAQSDVAQNNLHDLSAAQIISNVLLTVSEAKSIQEVRIIESQAAAVYWRAWRSVSITYPRKDISPIPDHSRTFGARISPLTGSPRLAVNPPNAMLNYLYALLELKAESRLLRSGLTPVSG